ncbi:hypothetical protein Leryth_013276 [Lithospermum erythrorhizon]|nr:hypothetical protein Leryth_013276 [Lithospermum erythrorhizon]
MLADGSENELCNYIPDGESGIQAKDISCGVTVVQMEPEFPHSPTETGEGSNQILGSFYEPLTQNKKPSGGSNNRVNNFGGGRAVNSTTKIDVRQIDKERVRYDHDVNFESGLDDRAPGADC